MKEWVLNFTVIIFYQSIEKAIGYWLSKTHWGKGVITSALAKVLEINKAHLGYTKITANVFEGNIGSQRVLEKNGFSLEATLKSHYSKDGQPKNGLLYSLIL